MGEVVKLPGQAKPRIAPKWQQYITMKNAHTLRAPQSGQRFYRDDRKDGLALRVLASGSRAWCSNFTHDGKLYRRPLGDLERCTREEAVNRLDRLIGDIKAGRDPQLAEREERRAKKQAEHEQQAFEGQTLKRLCELYVGDLQRRRRIDWRDAANIFTNWVYTGLEASKPAREVNAKEVAVILRRVVDAGKGRTAAKLRAYLRAAYQRAAAAQTDPTASSELLALGVEVNPVAVVASLSQFNRVREPKLARTQDGDKLAAVLRALSKDGRLAARAAWLCVLLGGQRPAQLFRARVDDFDEAAGTLVLRDPKGRRTAPREHVVPVVGPALPIVAAFAKVARARGSEWLLSFTGGKPLSTEEPGRLVTAIAKGLHAQFSLRDLRSAVETMLASLGVSEEIRAQLLSHGLGGIQQRHYNRYAFMQEKRDAVKKLQARIAKLVRQRGATPQAEREVTQ